MKRINVTSDSFIEFSVEVVGEDFQLQIGLEVMVQDELWLEFGAHLLSDSSSQLTLLIYYLKGHVFVKDSVV